MIQLFICIAVLILLIGLFCLLGTAISKAGRIDNTSFSNTVLYGFFAFFVVAEIIITPIVFLANQIVVATVAMISFSIIVTVCCLVYVKKDLLSKRKELKFSWYICATFIISCCMIVCSVFQLYQGYDTCYYIGQMNSFVYYGSFWTHDAFTGLTESSSIPLHYALSCFYPLWAIIAYIFKIDARILAMFTMRALCVLLFECVAFNWGYEIIGSDRNLPHDKKIRNGCICVIVCSVLGFFLMDTHSSSYMMMVRGYESKGYCAAVVGPMCALMLVKVCRDYKNMSNWKALWLVCWASVPIAMSSLAIVPVAVVITCMVLMIYYKAVKFVFPKMMISILPNVIFMLWYYIGTYVI